MEQIDLLYKAFLESLYQKGNAAFQLFFEFWYTAWNMEQEFKRMMVSKVFNIDVELAQMLREYAYLTKRKEVHVVRAALRRFLEQELPIEREQAKEDTE